MLDDTLWAAVTEGNAAAVERLVVVGASPDAKDDDVTALMNAAWSGNVECVRALLSRGADRTLRNDEGQTALEIAEGRSWKEGCTEAAALLRQ